MIVFPVPHFRSGGGKDSSRFSGFPRVSGNDGFIVQSARANSIDCETARSFCLARSSTSSNCRDATSGSSRARSLKAVSPCSEPQWDTEAARMDSRRRKTPAQGRLPSLQDEKRPLDMSDRVAPPPNRSGENSQRAFVQAVALVPPPSNTLLASNLNC